MLRHHNAALSHQPAPIERPHQPLPVVQRIRRVREDQPIASAQRLQRSLHPAAMNTPALIQPQRLQRLTNPPTPPRAQLHELHARSPAAQRLQPKRPGARIQVERPRAPHRIRPQNREYRPAHPIRCRSEVSPPRQPEPAPAMFAARNPQAHSLTPAFIPLYSPIRASTLARPILSDKGLFQPFFEKVFNQSPHWIAFPFKQDLRT